MSDKKQGNNSQFDRMKNRMAPKSNKPKRPFNFYWIYAIIAVILISMNLFPWGNAMVNINLMEFEDFVKDREIRKVIVYNEEVAEVFLTAEALKNPPHDKKVKAPAFGNGGTNPGPHYRLNIGPSEEFAKTLKEWHKEYEFTYEYRTRKDWGADIIGWVLPIAIMIGLWIFLMRRMGGGAGPGGQIFNIGKSKAQLFDQNNSVKVTFDDVAGLDEAKEEVLEIVDFLKNPKKYTELGAKIPKGALLVGNPGTGKTLLAKAVAGEAQVPFFSLSGSDFVEMFVGVGASRVRDLFKQAKEKAPSIVFIDEIDAIGRARGKSISQGANDERENTLNQLLTEMDGFGTNSGVIILAATNRADILDKALLRPGRFDRQIYVDMPDVKGREAILKVHLKPLKLADDIDIQFLAKQTPGFSGADIANICNEAALIAARKKKKKVEKQDFLDAVDRIIAGLEKKSKIITPDEKKRIAFHEAGHATVSWLLEHAHPLVKVTIVPRGQSLGAAWYLPEERQLTTRDQIMDEVKAALGGRAAEEIIFNEISTGALSDLEKVTKQVYGMIKIFGLNEKLGNISFYDSSGQADYGFKNPYSEKTAQLIDDEAHRIIEQAYVETKVLLTENQEKLSELANMLLDREVIFRDDLEKIFGKRTFARDIAREEEEKKALEEANAKAAEAKKEQESAEAKKVEEAKANEAKTNTETAETKNGEKVTEHKISTANPDKIEEADKTEKS